MADLLPSWAFFAGAHLVTGSEGWLARERSFDFLCSQFEPARLVLHIVLRMS